MDDNLSYVDELDKMQDLASQTTIQENIDNPIGNVFEYTQTNVVRYNDHIESVAIDKRKIERIKKLCNQGDNKKIPVADIFLGLSTLFAGAFLSALASSVPFELGWKAVVFYILSPVITTGCFVAFLFLRHDTNMSVESFSEKILEYLSDVDTDSQGDDK